MQITSTFKELTWCKGNDSNRIGLPFLGGLNISSGAGNTVGCPPKSSKEDSFPFKPKLDEQEEKNG